MREPEAIAHQRDARRATCAMREPEAIAHQRDARRATCAMREPEAIAHQRDARRATFSAGDGQLLCLAASAAARERLVDVPADILAGTLPAFIANPFDRPDLRPSELVPELETAGEPGPGLVNGHLPFRVAQRLADRGDLVGGMLIEMGQPASQGSVGETTDRGRRFRPARGVDADTDEARRLSHSQLAPEHDRDLLSRLLFGGQSSNGRLHHI